MVGWLWISFRSLINQRMASATGLETAAKTKAVTFGKETGCGAPQQLLQEPQIVPALSLSVEKAIYRWFGCFVQRPANVARPLPVSFSRMDAAWDVRMNLASWTYPVKILEKMMWRRRRPGIITGGSSTPATRVYGRKITTWWFLPRTVLKAIAPCWNLRPGCVTNSAFITTMIGSHDVLWQHSAQKRVNVCRLPDLSHQSAPALVHGAQVHVDTISPRFEDSYEGSCEDSCRAKPTQRVDLEQLEIALVL